MASHHLAVPYNLPMDTLRFPVDAHRLAAPESLLTDHPHLGGPGLDVLRLEDLHSLPVDTRRLGGPDSLPAGIPRLEDLDSLPVDIP